jgi:hypothetical protein
MRREGAVVASAASAVALVALGGGVSNSFPVRAAPAAACSYQKVARYHLEKISGKSPKTFKSDCRWASSLASPLLLNTHCSRAAVSTRVLQLQAPPAISRLRPRIHKTPCRLRRTRKGTIVTWLQREPTLEDILSDPITKEVMKADGVDPHQLSAMLKERGRMWAGAHARVRCACRHDQMPE